MPNYKNLVFKGGGVRGAAYIGALEHLYNEGLMRSVERTAGTSAGAITATILALNFEKFDDLKAIADTLDYKKVPSEEDETAKGSPKEGKKAKADRLALVRQVEGLFKNAQCVSRLVQEKGWYSSAYIYEWMRGVIASQFAVKKEAYTFRDFQDPKLHSDGRPFFSPYVTGSDISNRTSRIFSFETTPDMEVALAVRISMSIPMFFEAVPFQYPGTTGEQLYADGGVLWNYPVSLFDDTKYVRRLSDGINPETLGFFLFASPEHTHYKPVKNLIEYAGALFDSLLSVQDQFTLYGPRNKDRTIFINDMGVLPTQFDIAPGDEVYTSLYKSGLEASKDFFSKRMNWDMLIHRIEKRFDWKSTDY